jgi:hypothetical protein
LRFGKDEIFFSEGLDANSENQPVEAGQEWAGFWSLLYASFYDESRIQDR